MRNKMPNGCGVFQVVFDQVYFEGVIKCTKIDKIQTTFVTVA